MAELQGNTTIIGGVAVEVRADYSKLQAAGHQIKTEADRLARDVRIRLKVVPEPMSQADWAEWRRKLRQETEAWKRQTYQEIFGSSHARIASQAGFAIGGVPPPMGMGSAGGALRPPVMIAGGAAAAPAGGTLLLPGPGGGGLTVAGPGAASGRRFVVSRVVGSGAYAGGAGGGGAAARGSGGAAPHVVNMPGGAGPGVTPGGGGAGGGGGGVGLPGGGARPGSIGGWGAFALGVLGKGNGTRMSSVLAARVISGMVAGAINTAADLYDAMAGETLERREAGVAGIRNRITSVDNLVTGGLGQALNRITPRWAPQKLFATRVLGRMSDEEEARFAEEMRQAERQERLRAAKADAQRAVNAPAAAIARAARLEAAMFGRTAGEQGLLGAQADLDVYRRQLGDQWFNPTADQQDAIRGLEERIWLATRMRDREARLTSVTEGGRMRVAGMAAQAARARMAGRSIESIEREVAAEREARLGANAAELIVTPDSQRRIVADRQAKENELAELQERERIEKAKRMLAADTTDAIAAQGEAQLRILRQYYRADLAAFDRATAAKLASIDDLQARENERIRRQAERAVIVAEQERANEKQVTAAQASEHADRLRLQKRYREAQIAEFDAAVAARLAEIEDPKVKAAVAQAMRAQRAVLVEQQGEELQVSRIGLTARREIAGAQRQRWGRAAGVIGAIAGMDQELTTADADLRGDVLRTQRAELMALRETVAGVNNRTYAREFRVGADIAGATQGDSLKETNEILKRIEQALRNREGVQ